MTKKDQIPILNCKIRQADNQYDLDRKNAEIPASTDKDLPKYKCLTGKDSESTPSNIEKVRFDYSPLGIYAKNLTRLESVEKSNKQLANFIDARNNDNNDDDNDDNNDDDDNDDNDDNNDSPDDDNKTLKISNTQSPYYYRNIIRFTPFTKNESINKFKKYSLKTQYNEIKNFYNKLNELKDIKAKNNVQDFLKRVVMLNTEKIYKEKYFKPYLENYDKNYDKLQS